MRSNDTISKINTVNGTTGNAYLTNSDSITVNNVTYEIDNGFDFYGLDPEVQEAAKFKKTFNINSNIPFVKLDQEIPLIENYNEAHRYVYSRHDCFSNENVNNRVNLPKSLSEWVYYSNNTQVTLPQTLTQALVENFVDGNLNVYAKWTDIFAIRVIVYFADTIQGFTPLCDVGITSTNSYTGNAPLTENYSKLTHRKANANDYVHIWTNYKGEFGTNTQSGHMGNGRPVYDGDGNYIPCYYGIKDNDTFTITLSNLKATYNGQTLTNAIKPYYSNHNYVGYVSDTLTSYFDRPQLINLNSSYNSFYLQSSISHTDLTYFFPIVLNTYSLIIRCYDSNTSTTSAQGYVGITSINHSPEMSDTQINANCVNGETVRILASAKTGYVFSHWEDGNGNPLSQYPNNVFSLTINSSVEGSVYVACFTSGLYQITYHKQVPQVD